MASAKPDDVVVIGIFHKTRKRIKKNAADKDITMKDYVEMLVPTEEKGE